MISDAKKYFLGIVKKTFFSHRKNFFRAKKFSYCTKKNSCAKKNILAVRKTLFCHYIKNIFVASENITENDIS